MMATRDVNRAFGVQQATLDSLLPIVDGDFAFTLPAGSIDDKVRDLADHLLSVTIPSASPTGCTADEILDWLFSKNGTKSVAAFRECAKTLHAVLVLHPGASTFLSNLIVCLARADDIRTAVRDFHHARKVLSSLKMKPTIPGMTALGIPEYLHMELKKNGGDPHWFPPIGLVRSPEWMPRTRRVRSAISTNPIALKPESFAVSMHPATTGRERVRRLFEAQEQSRVGRL